MASKVVGNGQPLDAAEVDGGREAHGIRHHPATHRQHRVAAMKTR